MPSRSMESRTMFDWAWTGPAARVQVAARTAVPRMVDSLMVLSSSNRTGFVTHTTLRLHERSQGPGPLTPIPRSSQRTNEPQAGTSGGCQLPDGPDAGLIAIGAEGVGSGPSLGRLATSNGR